MILLNIFGSALGILQVSLVLCLFARYIYLEKGFSSLKQLKLFWGIAAGISLVCTACQEIFGFMEDYLLLIIIGIFFLLYCTHQRKETDPGDFPSVSYSWFCNIYIFFSLSWVLSLPDTTI